MTDNKKYYWFKLRDDFFSSLPMKKLRRMERGDTYTVIYLKMLLLAMKNGGMIRFLGVESSLCEEVATLLDEKTEDVTELFALLSKWGLGEMADGGILLPEVLNNTGKESSSAQRMRTLRDKREEAPVTSPSHCDRDAAHCDTEIEKEIEIDTETEIEKEKEKEKRESDGADRSAKRARYAAPSLDEIRQYVRERNLSVDPVSFYTYFDAGGWTDSRGQKVRSWKQKLLTWENHNDNMGGRSRDSGTDHSNSVSEWDNIAYTCDWSKV